MNCLDAETLAAWFDGGLKGAALEDVRAHVAACDRCQMLVGAMGRTRAAVPVPVQERAASFAKASEPKPRRWLAWAIPLTAAATAVAVWVAIPEQRNVPAVTPATAPAQKPEATAPAPLQAPATPTEAAPAAPPPTTETRRARERSVAEPSQPKREPARAEADARDERALRAPAATAPLAAPAEPAGAAAPSANVLAERVQLRPPCGPSWSAPMPAAGTEIAAGSSPGPGICWVVGRGGAVFRSVDGRTWQRVTFPEITDLSAVSASDDRSASVSSADGRTFTTSDGGVTWIQR